MRSTDLLALANINPDADFGLNLSIEESLADLSSVCFQAALLYTSSRVSCLLQKEIWMSGIENMYQ